jgi:hypothetical protein
MTKCKLHGIVCYTAWNCVVHCMELSGTLHGIEWYTARDCVVHCMGLCGTLQDCVVRSFTNHIGETAKKTSESLLHPNPHIASVNLNEQLCSTWSSLYHTITCSVPQKSYSPRTRPPPPPLWRVVGCSGNFEERSIRK